MGKICKKAFSWNLNRCSHKSRSSVQIANNEVRVTELSDLPGVEGIPGI